MKLNIVPARQGMTWATQGMRTFFKQPLALSGLFFMFMALLSLATLIPLVGSALALALLPAATLGLMAATQEAQRGKFPMPLVLISAFRAGRQQLRAMAVLGALYAAGFLCLMGVSALIDGGKFASLYLLGGKMSEELVMQGDFQAAMWTTLLLYTPLSLLFWHAPALVHWHGVPPVKSLFFSLLACLRNWRAMAMYGLVWLLVFVGAIVIITVIAVVLGNPGFATVALFPASLLIMAMFFTSLHFTFQGCFGDLANPEDETQSGEPPHDPSHPGQP